MINNPILPGFNPDPSICRRGDDYYIATSTFEWFPGVAIYRSRDMKNWQLYTHVLNDEKTLDLRRLAPSSGIWAPCLTWCEEDGLFYVVYTIMQNRSAGFFDLDNYVVTAPEIEGPWSEPVYLNSSGFDPSMFHDEDGRKWVVNLEWESRMDYEHPGIIVIQEYSPKDKGLIGQPTRIWRGGTDRGCVEGPHLYKRNGFYYLMCAEGGTGYGHCVTMARSRDLLGDYEGDPMNPIVTSAGHDFYSRHDSEYLKPYMYNPHSILQKSGHASWIEDSQGQCHLVHLCARPYVPELRSVLGRETALQRVSWNEEGWLRLEGGGNTASETVEEAKLTIHKWPHEPEKDTFENGWNSHYYAPRIAPESFADIDGNKMRIRGQESLSSLNRVSLIARRVTDFQMSASTSLCFKPECFQQSAGMAFYYDNAHYLYLRKYYSESLGGHALGISHVSGGNRDENKSSRVLLEGIDEVRLKISLKDKVLQCAYSFDEDHWISIGPGFDASIFSDEYPEGGGFTGAFIGMCCIDSQNRSAVAEFDYFQYERGPLQ